MKNREKESFLSEILADDRLADLREDSLLKGIVLLRRQRRRRLILQTSLASALICLLLFSIAQRPTSPPLQSNLLSARPVPAQPSTKAVTAVKHLTDDELLALFPNRSVALIGEPGHQQLVFLEHQSGAQ
jgi:hypothetical protein